MIVIVNYGIGNLSSVLNMLKKSGAQAVVSNKAEDVRAASKLVLPGVGHFDHGMRMLNASGLREALDEAALARRVPVLGICLGAQILGKGSEEGDEPGLGWIDMECRRLPSSERVRVPHMSWNTIRLMRHSYIFDAMDEAARFYFVHSYAMHCTRSEDVLATTTHGVEFVCAVQRANVLGTQFHPEKSLRHGLAVMRSFAQGPAS